MHVNLRVVLGEVGRFTQTPFMSVLFFMLSADCVGVSPCVPRPRPWLGGLAALSAAETCRDRTVDPALGRTTVVEAPMVAMASARWEFGRVAGDCSRGSAVA